MHVHKSLSNEMKLLRKIAELEIHAVGVQGVFEESLVCIGSNCPGISGTVPDYKNLSRVLECLVKCPGRVLTYVLRQENRKGSVAIVSTRCCE